MDTERTGNPFGEQGLTAAEVGERIAAGKVNVNTELKTKSVRELVVENVCTLFNLINILLAALVIATGAWKNLTFLGVVFLNSAIGVIQSLRSKRMVDKLTLLASKKAVAIRDGAPVELDLDQIVLDDAIRLGRGDQIPRRRRRCRGRMPCQREPPHRREQPHSQAPGRRAHERQLHRRGHGRGPRHPRGRRQLCCPHQQRGQVRQEGQLGDHERAQRHRAVCERLHGAHRPGAVLLERPQFI